MCTAGGYIAMCRTKVCLLLSSRFRKSSKFINQELMSSMTIETNWFETIHLRPFIWNHVLFRRVHTRPHSHETTLIWDHISRELLFILPHFARPPQATPDGSPGHPCRPAASHVTLPPPPSLCHTSHVSSLVGFPCQPVLFPWAKVFILSGWIILLSSFWIILLSSFKCRINTKCRIYRIWFWISEMLQKFIIVYLYHVGGVSSVSI